MGANVLHFLSVLLNGPPPTDVSAKAHKIEKKIVNLVLCFAPDFLTLYAFDWPQAFVKLVETE